MKDNTDKILARVSILSNIELSNLTLVKSKEQNQIEFNGNKAKIKYTNIGSLSHEISHACFTPQDLYQYKQNTKHSLLNAIEDYRIENCMNKSDKYLFKLIEDDQKTMDLQQLNQAPKEFRNMYYIALQDKFKSIMNISQDDKEVLNKVCERIKQNPFDWYSSIEAYELAMKLFKDKEQKQNQQQAQGNKQGQEKGQKQESKQAQGQKQEQQNKERELTQEEKQELENAKRNDQYAVQEMKENKIRGYGMESLIDSLKEYSIPNINLNETFKHLKRDLSDRTFNTNRGKLNNKRIGLYPNSTIFQKTQKYKKVQRLSIVYDVSGSMKGMNAQVVINFLKAVKEAESTKLKVNYIAFATESKEAFIKNQTEFSTISRELYGGTRLDTGIDILEKKINTQERNTILIITDGSIPYFYNGNPLTEERIKKLESIANVYCIVIQCNSQSLIDSGFSHVFEVDSIQQIPEKLKIALVQGK